MPFQSINACCLGVFIISGAKFSASIALNSPLCVLLTRSISDICNYWHSILHQISQSLIVVRQVLLARTSRFVSPEPLLTHTFYTPAFNYACTSYFLIAPRITPTHSAIRIPHPLSLHLHLSVTLKQDQLICTPVILPSTLHFSRIHIVKLLNLLLHSTNTAISSTNYPKFYSTYHRSFSYLAILQILSCLGGSF